MKKWERDKWRHFFVGIPLGIILAAVCWMVLMPAANMCLIAAFCLLLIICYGFELVSYITGKGHYEIMDAIAGIAGGTIGIAITWMSIM